MKICVFPGCDEGGTDEAEARRFWTTPQYLDLEEMRLTLTDWTAISNWAISKFSYNILCVSLYVCFSFLNIKVSVIIVTGSGTKKRNLIYD